MGVVVMKSEGFFMYRGYPFSTAVLYVYCDQCGSFDVKPYWRPARWLALMATAALVPAGIFAAFRPAGPIFWLFPCLLLCFLLFRHIWGDEADDEYRCRHCGQVSRANYNTLGYRSDTARVDVPDQVARKRYRDIGGPEDYGYDLEDALKPPEAAERTDRLEPLRQVGKDVLVILTFPFLVIFFAVLSVLGVAWMIIGSLWIDIGSKLFARLFSGKQVR